MDNDLEHFPKLIIFDLDFTLWPFWVDTHVSPPFHLDHSGNVLDSTRYKIDLYPDVKEILDELSIKNIKLGIASRTGAIYDAKDMLKLLRIGDYFHHKEIYPGSKVRHFENLREQSNCHYSEMLFFDDEPRNIKDVTTLGVTCILAKNGLTRTCFADGLKRFNINVKSKLQKSIKDFFSSKEGKGKI